jgi:Na+/melibiose symporter-like transporter
VPNLIPQNPATLLTLRVLVGVVPAVLLCAGIAFAAVYPLSREKHLEVRKELAKRRGKSET